MIQYADALTPFLVPVDQVHQYPNNPKNGDVEEIMASIQRNGMYRPLIVQRSTGYILAGNHSYQACLGLNAKHVPVVHVDVNDTIARRIVLADNRTADLGQYDEADLLALLKDASTSDEMGLYGTGYDTDYVEKLEQLLNTEEPIDVSAPEPTNPTPITCPACGYSWGGAP